jgi:glycerophosphoryl diester phosphodiesterase
MAAFKYALDLGADAVEFDVHLTTDGQLVVNHDYYLNPSLTRDENNAWIQKQAKPIHMQSFEELKKYKLGRIKPYSLYAFIHHHAQSSQDEPIPTLKDVIALLKNYPEASLLIEIKTTPLTPEDSSDPELISKAVIEELNKTVVKDRCSILAFDARVVQFVRQLDPKVKIFLNQSKQSKSNSLWYAGYDLKDFQGSIPALIHKLGGDGWSAKYGQLNKENVKQAHDYGQKVYAWTVNSTEKMKRLKDYGVDGIITDRPDQMLDMLQRRKS